MDNARRIKLKPPTLKTKGLLLRIKTEWYEELERAAEAAGLKNVQQAIYQILENTIEGKKK